MPPVTNCASYINIKAQFVTVKGILYTVSGCKPGCKDLFPRIGYFLGYGDSQKCRVRLIPLQHQHGQIIGLIFIPHKLTQVFFDAL